MLSKILSATTLGLDGVVIKVEVDVANRGFPTFTIVGLPNKAIEESKERVRTAIRNSSFDMPETRIVVNLAPADIPKEGSLFDLPIAVGILTASQVITPKYLTSSLFVGELSLDGNIRPVPGLLPIALLAEKKRIQRIFFPEKNGPEMSIVAGVEKYPIKSLGQLVLHLNDTLLLHPQKNAIFFGGKNDNENDDYNFAHIRGQEQAKRALEIAAAGFHNVHLKGPPGTGKTLMAKTFSSILPPLENDEIIEVLKIASITNNRIDDPSSTVRPFRSPHHTISRVGLIGGGSRLLPGEISLAHRGVLFLDEFPEFPRAVLESLRQPIEDGVVTITRAHGSLTFPARFIFLAASNPCPCGFRGHPKKPCRCSAYQIIKYQKRISGPLIDRIDIHVDVYAVNEQELLGDNNSEASGTIRTRVEKARMIQKKRFSKNQTSTNGEMSTGLIKKYCPLSNEVTALLKKAITTMSLSARSYFKVIKLSRTIADLQGQENIDVSHIAEALQYRSKD